MTNTYYEKAAELSDRAIYFYERGLITYDEAREMTRDASELGKVPELVKQVKRGIAEVLDHAKWERDLADDLQLQQELRHP